MIDKNPDIGIAKRIINDETTIKTCQLIHLSWMDLLTLISRTSLSIILGVSSGISHFYSIGHSVSRDPDQTQHCAASDLGLHCLPMSTKRTLGSLVQ